MRLGLAAVLVCFVSIACGSSPRLGGNYPRRAHGCAVKRYPADPPPSVEDLGVVMVACGGDGDCERKLLDEACDRGANVAWGLGANSLNAAKLVAHVGHTTRAAMGARERGCSVQVFDQAPPMRTENIGPVTAMCAESDSRDTCLRELQDQACLLGADVLWQVSGPAPAVGAAKAGQRMTGRAAHTTP